MLSAAFGRLLGGVLLRPAHSEMLFLGSLAVLSLRIFSVPLRVPLAQPSGDHTHTSHDRLVAQAANTRAKVTMVIASAIAKMTMATIGKLDIAHAHGERGADYHGNDDQEVADAVAESPAILLMRQPPSQSEVKLEPSSASHYSDRSVAFTPHDKRPASPDEAHPRYERYPSRDHHETAHEEIRCAKSQRSSTPTLRSGDPQRDVGMRQMRQLQQWEPVHSGRFDAQPQRQMR